MKRILLVNPHETQQLGFTNPPLGLLYLAGALLPHGFNVRIVDGCLEGRGAVEKAIEQFRPDLVGITCLTPGRKQALQLAKTAKSHNPAVKIVLGGVHPTIMHRQILEHYPFVDYIVLGEGEKTFLEMALGKEPSQIRGLAYRDRGSIVKTPSREYVPDLDDTPFPAYHLIDLRRYPARGEEVFRGIDLRREPRISVIFSRGCTGHCDFCSTWWIWKGWRHRSPKNMVDEIELLYNEHGIKHFCFADDTLTADRQATISLCDEILARKLTIAFHVTTRTDCVDETVLQKLRAAGCYQIAFGVETGSPLLLENMGKENDIATAERAIRLAKKTGMSVTALIIVGNRGENENTIRQTISFLKRAQPDVVGCAGALWIFPGTKLYHECKREGFITDDFWLGDEPYKIYTKEFPLEKLEEMRRRVIDYRASDASIPDAYHSTKKLTNPSLLEKWNRYVQAELNEYSATSQWPDAQEQHLELMEKIPTQCVDLLDIGCGDGWSTHTLQKIGKKAVGLTINPKEAEHALMRYGLQLVVRDMHDLPFDRHRFDCIYCRESYEHSVAPYIALCEMNRVLRPGGYALINLPWKEWIREDSHYSVFTESQMREMFYKCRFVVEEEGRAKRGHFWYLARKVAEIGEPHPFSPPVPGKAWHYDTPNEGNDSKHFQGPNPAIAPAPLNTGSKAPPHIICQMRIKNEERWLKSVLDGIALVADGIVILDDGSTDRTPEICRAHPAVIDYVWQDEKTLDEVRDKNRLLKMTLAQHPAWALCMDGDEILEESAPERILDAIRSCPEEVSVLDVEFLYMWNDLHHYRTDGIYKRIYHHRLFKLQGQKIDELTFLPSKHGSNFHCESVPTNLCGRSMEIDLKIKHLGYMTSEDRERKYLWYKSNDPIHAAQGYYEHLLDQPGMTLVEWHERPFPKKQSCVKAGSDGSTVPKQELKPDYYYAQARRNIIGLVPVTATKVLDVGCGHGLTGGLLRSRRNIEVVGIEIHPEVADTARQHLSHVLVGDLETMTIPYPEGYFDCIILADIIEHLINPWTALKKLARYLHPSGLIIASIPNIRNIGILKKVIEGSWTYQEQGILDRTHLRFFALRDMIALFSQAGIEVQVAEIVRDSLFDKLVPALPSEPVNMDLGNILLRDVSPKDLEELIAQQFILTGRKILSEAKEPGKQPPASVVIPVFNNLFYTKQCISSILAVGEGLDLEILVVDNGSTDGTPEYLQQLDLPVRSIRLATNLGFAKGCNAGAKAARGKYLVFLNNDTVVLPGWLTGMISCIERDPSIGLVGNLQIYPDNGKVQQAGIVCGPNKMLYSIYSNQLSADHPAVNKPRPFQFVAGSCMLIKREVFNELGGFDEAYLNSCEDVDLCMKVGAMRLKVFYCPQSRIMHYESKTAKGHSKSDANYRLFLERWGHKIVRDDFEYLREDGFSPPSRTPNKGGPQKVALIAPPRYFKQAALSGYTGFSKNLGIGYIAAVLRQAGVDVSVLDAFALGINQFIPVDLPNGRVFRCGLSYETIASGIPADIDFIGISVPFTNVARIAFELAHVLKDRFPRAKIVLGGVHPSAFPEESMQPGVDYVICGEGESSMLELVQGNPPELIQGLCQRDAFGRVIRPSTRACITSLDDLPFPAWDLLPMERYFKVSPRGDRTHRSLSIITSRGCPFACRFCSVHPVFGRNWRGRSPQNVLSEILTAHKLHHINHLEIEDDNFTLNKQRAMAILEGIKTISPAITWSAHNGVRVDTLDEELLTAIKTSGCIQLNLAIEHGSPSVLKAMNKQLSLNKVRQVVEICGRLSIPTMGFCLVGYPGETSEAFRESFLFFKELKQLGLTTIAPFIVNAYPGTELYKTAKANGRLNPATDRQLFFLEDEFVSVTTPDFDERAVRLRKMAMELLSHHPHMDPDGLPSFLSSLVPSKA